MCSGEFSRLISISAIIDLGDDEDFLKEDPMDTCNAVSACVDFLSKGITDKAQKIVSESLVNILERTNDIDLSLQVRNNQQLSATKNNDHDHDKDNHDHNPNHERDNILVAKAKTTTKDNCYNVRLF